MRVISILPDDPDYLVPIHLATLGMSFKGRLFEEDLFMGGKRPSVPSVRSYHRTRINERIDDLLYWDENKSTIYVEAIAKFSGTSELMRFRKEIATELHLNEFPCQTCGCKNWRARNVDVKTVTDKKGRRWKCFSIIFACSDCLTNSRVSERSIRMQGWKYALKKVARGAKDFLNQIKKITISGNLSDGSGSATLDLGDQQVRLERCPLL